MNTNQVLHTLLSIGAGALGGYAASGSIVAAAICGLGGFLLAVFVMNKFLANQPSE